MGRILFLTMILGSSIAFAQSQVRQEAIKFHEFDSVVECDVNAIMSNFSYEMVKYPEANAIIITYQSVNAYPADYNSSPMYSAVEKQIFFLGLDKSRFELIKGGFRNKITAELWIVPKGAEKPKPTGTLPKPTIPTDKTFVFAKNTLVPWYAAEDPIEYLLPSAKKERLQAEKEQRLERKKIGQEEFDFVPTKEDLESIKFAWAISSFGELLKNREDSNGLIIFYADIEGYSIKNIRKNVEQGRIRIATDAKILPARIKVMFGGYRQISDVEMWIIPPNGKLPEPTPEKRIA
jgi:hypothetical protein